MSDHSPTGTADAPTHAIVAAHTGVALLRAADPGTPSMLIDPTRAALVRVGRAYELTPLAPSVQDLGVLSFASAILDHLGQPASRVDAGRGAPEPIRWAPRLTLALQRLARSGREPDPDGTGRAAVCPPMHADVAELLREVFASLDVAPTGTGRPRPRAYGDHRELARAAKVLLATRPERLHLLADVARAVNASPFHLEHVFNTEAGIPLHRFLLDLRLALALARLGESNVRLNDLALNLGFATHSHFSAVFRRRVGQTPRAVRQTLRVGVVVPEAFGPPPGAQVGCFSAWIRMLRLDGDSFAIPMTLQHSS